MDARCKNAKLYWKCWQEKIDPMELALLVPANGTIISCTWLIRWRLFVADVDISWEVRP